MAMTTGYLGTWGTAAGILPAFDITDWVTNPGTVSTSTVARVDSPAMVTTSRTHAADCWFSGRCVIHSVNV